MATEEITVRVEKSYVRFALPQRIEHIVLLLSFTTLAITGLIQKFSTNPISNAIYRLLGGIENTRLIHHIAAIVILVLSAYHVIAVLYKLYVRRRSMTMLPGLTDVTDALDVVRYNLGLTKQHPNLPRYNFAEKFEYWALVWGTVVMAITGFVLWNPVLTAKIFPGQFIPAAKAAHGGEAILAVLAILVWHFYNVHIKMFNRSIFTGKMTRPQMHEEHNQELEQIEAGIARPLPPEAVMRKRERVFIPVALLMTAASALAIFWFATYETTAIETVPPVSESVEVFSPLTPTPIPSPTVENNELGAPIPHPIEGQEQCNACHGPEGVRPYPADHVDRPNESCRVCHSPGEAGPSGEPGVLAAAIPHALEGKELCSTCHGDSASLVPMPPAHIQPVTDDTCQLCHQPAATASGTPAAVPNPIPHPIDGEAYANCTTCHGAGMLKPFPTSHASFATDSCTTCHQPSAATSEAPASGATESGTPAAEGATAGGPNPIPHPIDGGAYADCTTCHGAGMLKPFPASHASFATDSCTTCHQPSAATPEAPASGATESGTPATGGATAGSPNPIPHPIDGEAYANCTACHGAGMLKPFPASHASFATDSCTTCHQPSAATPEATPAGGEDTTTAGGAKPIPHSIVETAYQDCTACHGAGKVKPFPPSHEAFPVSVCAGCHPPQVGQ